MRTRITTAQHRICKIKTSEEVKNLFVVAISGQECEYIFTKKLIPKIFFHLKD
jgi:hypothetical protein